MAVIETLLDAVDSAATSIGASAYEAVASSVLPIVQIAAILIVVLTGINLMIQAVPMTLQNGVSLIVRLGAVVAFLASFSNFNSVYGVLTNAPSEVGAIVLNEITGGQVTDLYGGLDNLYGRSLDVGDAVAQNGSYIAGAISGVVMFLVAALMAVASVIVIGAAKLMLGVLIILGPIAIACTMFKQSAPVFEAYVKLALGFAFVPLLAAAMAGFTIFAAEAVIPDDLDSMETIGDLTSFIVIMLLGTGLMSMVPSTASSLAQTGIGIAAAAASTYVTGSKGIRGAAGAAKGAGQSVSGAVSAASGKAMGSTASTASKAGAATVNTVAFLASRLKK